MRLIRNFKNGSKLIFDKGRFDDWCVFWIKKDGTKVAPKDDRYFNFLLEMSKRFGNEKVYNDFVTIYEQTTTELNPKVLKLIIELSKTYIGYELKTEIVLTILYATMIAEENKLFAKLKKRIKRLGVHQVLIENMKPEEAAKCSYGKKWTELSTYCCARGF